MRKYKLVGLTGRTGSGKSAAREVFMNNGYEIIDADALAREVIGDKILQSDIAAYFGADLINNGAVDRKKLSERAFKDSERVKTLNAIFHPRITRLFIDKLNALAKSGADKILFDAPQLFEAKLDIICDITLALISEDEKRIKRITERDGITEEMAKSRLKIQLPDSFFIENCDYYIENNSTVEKLQSDLEELVSRI